VSSEANPWWIVAMSGVVSLIGLWLNARGAWLSTRAASQDKQNDRIVAERAQALATHDARQATWIARQEQELERARRRIEELEVERDRAWELARAWKARAHELRHEFNNFQQMLMSPRGLRDVAWPKKQEPLPDLKDIKERPRPTDITGELPP